MRLHCSCCALAPDRRFPSITQEAFEFLNGVDLLNLAFHARKIDAGGRVGRECDDGNLDQSRPLLDEALAVIKHLEVAGLQVSADRKPVKRAVLECRANIAGKAHARRDFAFNVEPVVIFLGDGPFPDGQPVKRLMPIEHLRLAVALQRRLECALDDRVAV